MEFVWVFNESERSIGFIHDTNVYGHKEKNMQRKKVQQRKLDAEILGVASKWKEEN